MSRTTIATVNEREKERIRGLVKATCPIVQVLFLKDDLELVNNGETRQVVYGQPWGDKQPLPHLHHEDDMEVEEERDYDMGLSDREENADTDENDGEEEEEALAVHLAQAQAQIRVQQPQALSLPKAAAQSLFDTMRGWFK